MSIILLSGDDTSWYFDAPSLLEDIQLDKHHEKVPYNISKKARKFIIDCLERYDIIASTNSIVIKIVVYQVESC
jgi:hypothetical protein